MNIDSYLERIDYSGPRLPTLQTLRNLQLAHLWTVPFENLSIHAGELIVLEDEALFQKIVTRRRGGFCYELNGLFSALLSTLGFNVSMLSARIAEASGTFTPEFDHMPLLVTLDAPYLVDVGFGDTFREPLKIDLSTVNDQFGRGYRIVTDDGYFLLMERKKEEEWKVQYRFNLQNYQYADYAEMCHYHQNSPKSHFTQRTICSRATQAGRVTLSEMRFITTTLQGDRQERLVSDEIEYAALLLEHFGISM